MKRFVLSIFITLIACTAWAQTGDNIVRRYVLTKENGGSYTHKGTGWDDALDNLQEAINDLNFNLRPGQTGHVYVGEGIYTPTETTGAETEVQHTSFKMYAGIQVYGGFTKCGKKLTTDTNGNNPGDDNYIKTYSETEFQSNPNDRYLANGKTIQANTTATSKLYEWDLLNETVLCGTHTDKTNNFLVYKEDKTTYEEEFPNNSYHVVWFATNGFIPTSQSNQQEHGTPLNRQSVLDGCTVTGGNAGRTLYTQRVHESMGGGIYMVENAVVRNCRICDNSAALRGGGIYMDGGGQVEHCFIRHNQTLGAGLTDGYGGGVCVDYDGAIRHSMIIDNIGRIGGGMAISMQRSEYPRSDIGEEYYKNTFTPAAAGCVVANNTATIEGGGMAMLHGGTANHMTIVRNHCAGAQVNINGHKYGCSGGLYIDVGATFFNSVLWGNTTQTNGNVQYGAFIGDNAEDKAQQINPYIYFSAISNYEDADWTGSVSSGIVSLLADNARAISERGTTRFYPEFIVPSALDDNQKAGITGHSYNTPYNANWQPMNYSSLVGKGVRLDDFFTSRAAAMTKALIQTDINGNQRAPRGCLGAYVASPITITPADIASLEDENETIKTLFVDPDFQRAAKINDKDVHPVWKQIGETQDMIGNGNFQTITTPFTLSHDICWRITATLHIASLDNGYTNWGSRLLSNCQTDNELTDGFLIFLCSGSQTTTKGAVNLKVNSTAYNTDTSGAGFLSAGTASLVIEHSKDDNGQFHTDFIINSPSREYKYTSTARLKNINTLYSALAVGHDLRDIKFETQVNEIYVSHEREAVSRGDSWDNPIVFLGDALYQAGRLSEAGHTVQVLLKEGTHSVTNRQVNVGIDGSADTRARLRDLTANIQSNVRLYGGFPNGLIGAYTTLEQADGGILSRDPLLYPTVITANVTGLEYDDNVAHVLTVDNAHNVIIDGLAIQGGNTVPQSGLNDQWVPANTNGAGILLTGGHDIKLRNATLSNCTTSAGHGAAIYAGDVTALSIENVIVNNNTDRSPLLVPSAIQLDNCTAAIDHALLRGNIGGITQRGGSLTVSNSAFHANTLYMFDGEVLEGRSVEGGIIDDALVAVTCHSGSLLGTNNMFDAALTAQAALFSNSYALFTYNASVNPGFTYPIFTNPTRNVGCNREGHVTVYGGSPDFTPRNMNPMVNAAADTQGTDITTTTPRTMGGAADIGPIEATTLPQRGEVIYVRTNGSDTNDGLSWATAVASISHALTLATREVWVAAGTYNERVVMRDGISILGGFAPCGNPGNDIADPEKVVNVERNISNSDRGRYALYRTVIDAQATVDNQGRPLTCAEMAQPVMVEGVTLTGGYTTNANNGAGASIARNCTLKNVLVTRNYYTTTGAPSGHHGGAGVYMGKGAVIKNSQISGNKAVNLGSGNFCSGGGVLMSGECTLINSLIVRNEIEGSSTFSQLGAAMYIQKQCFIYNCTVAFNAGINSNTANSDRRTFGGVWDQEATSHFYNCIFWGNYGNGTTVENFFQVESSGMKKNNFMYNCYQSAWYPGVASVGDNDNVNDKSIIHLMNTTNQATSTWNTYLQQCYDNHPFVSVDARYGMQLDEGVERIEDNFALKPYTANSLSRYCINMGAYQDVLDDKDIFEDIVGADRVQDCTVDKGAYEYDGTNEIQPTYFDLNGNPVDGVGSAVKAVYYVSEAGNGTASAQNIQNAACAQKLQKVLDAAGREKFRHPVIDVVVKLEQYDSYVPTREHRFNDDGSLRSSANSSDTRAYTILVPHGITVEGGYKFTASTTTESFQENERKIRIKKAHGSEYIKDDGERAKYLAIDPSDDSFVWILTTQGEDQVTLRNYATGKYLGAMTASPSTGTPMSESPVYFTIDQYDGNGCSGCYRFAQPLQYVGNDNNTHETAYMNAGSGNQIIGFWDATTSKGSHWAIEDVDPKVITTYTPQRDIKNCPTVLNGQHTHQGVDVSSYHVVTFTDAVYGPNGLPMGLETDASGNTLHELTEETIQHATIAHLSAAHQSQSPIGRAVLDGLFIRNGNADGLAYSNRIATGSLCDKIDSDLPNNRGGAAIVPSYAHIRNCIVEHNSASVEGGALYLKPRALVSGCIIRNNSCSGNGGAVAVYEPTADEWLDTSVMPHTLRDPAQELSLPAMAGPDYPYANIFTSTIVNNKAEGSGGGIHFATNLRVNSTVLWRNQASSGYNISGQMNPGASSATQRAPWDFPLQYCAVENYNAPGFNNFSIATLAGNGTRWLWQGYHDYSNSEDQQLIADHSQYYALHKYSRLARTGMLIHDYESLRQAGYWPTLESADIMGVDRTHKATHDDLTGDVTYHDYQLKRFIEVGARALNDEVLPSPVEGMDILLTRIYVALPAGDDIKIADALIDNGTKDGATDNDRYYAQMGSTMAFPMNSLNDALEYIRAARLHALSMQDKDKAKALADQGFEIFVGPGTFYPSQSVKGAYCHTRANTFLIPEGVAIYGGIGTNADWYYGKETSGDTDIAGTTIMGATTNDILARRPAYDVNQNGIVEGWGLMNQTILSGDVMNSNDAANSFHVITINAAEQYVGMLPTATPVDIDGDGDTDDDDWDGTTFKYRGKSIILDGLQIRDGQAIGYTDPVNSLSTYYKGGAICVDGNWLSAADNSTTYVDRHMETTLPGYYPADNEPFSQNDHDRAKRAVAYRNIPLIIRNSLITDNQACMGGAVFTNGELQVYSSQFARNHALMNTDTDVPFDTRLGQNEMTYYGRGGAIDAQFLAVLVNTIFANNTASGTLGVHDYTNDYGGETGLQTFSIPNSVGGAVSAGENAALEIMNCHFVRNEAGGYPAIYCYAPNAGYTDIDAPTASLLAKNRHAIVNSLFWGNTNTVPNSASDRESHYEMIMNPVSPFRYDGYTGIGDGQQATTPQALWFCAFEKGTWYEPKSLPNTNDQHDFRRMAYSDGKGGNPQTLFIPSVVKAQRQAWATANGIDDIHRYDFNIELSADNNAADGPNFINPSVTPGVTGYMPEADWMMGRINNVVDQGWTYMQPNKQNTAFATDNDTYSNSDDNLAYSASNHAGPYITIAAMVNASLDQYTTMPYGNMQYMQYADNTAKAMLRVSMDLAPSHGQSYIDIGAYEYPHVRLQPDEGDEIDVIWVAEKERQNVGESDGSTWAKATSDLQGAIETLLASRNNHKKEIRITQGTYRPVYTIDNNMAFTVSSSRADDYVFLPSEESLVKAYDNKGISRPEAFGIKSLLLRGGYSNDVADVYDAVKYPVTLEMGSKVGAATSLYQHTFLIKDAQQRLSKEEADHSVSTLPTNATIPLTIEGITFANDQTSLHNDGTDSEPLNGGAALFYKDADHNAPTDQTKLTIRNCVFTNTTSHPAVTIGSGGGNTLIMNSLWHGNRSGIASINACSTTLLNCTFACNNAPIRLDDNSALYNSILWNPALGGSAEFVGAFTMTDNAIRGLAKTGGNNDALGDTNNDLQHGPNFTDPDNNVFTVQPGVLVTGKGNQGIYKLMAAVDDLSAELKASIISNPKVYISDHSSNIKHDEDYLCLRDLAGLSRLYGTGLERGAYETTGTVDQRVFYVKNTATAGVVPDGTSWALAYPGKDLQTAINAAAVWYATVGAPGKHKAYVFVRGENNNMKDISLQDGVEVYGSIQRSFDSESQRQELAAPQSPTNTELDNDTHMLQEYITDILNAPEYAIASPRARKSIITSVKAERTDMTALLHGFEIKANENDNQPIVDINVGASSAVALRNCIIHGFQSSLIDSPTADAPLAAVSIKGGALLYNCLLRDNRGIVNIGDEHAYMLNCTVSGTSGETANSSIIRYNGTGSKDDHVIKSIETTFPHVTVDGQASPFTPCFNTAPHIGAMGNGWSDIVNDANLPYQLNFNAGNYLYKPFDNSLLSSSLQAFHTVGYIDLQADRDLLGNPRQLTDGYTDYGCYETWDATASRPLMAQAYDNNDNHINTYPHLGSVAYIHDSGSISLGKMHTSQASTAFDPSYLFIAEGGSLYGNGEQVNLAYLSVERTLPHRFALLSLPFPFNNIVPANSQSSITVTTGNQPAIADIYTYDGAKRASMGFKWEESDSECWTEATTVDENTGWLLDLGESKEGRKVTFTAFGDSYVDYIYNEGPVTTDNGTTTDKTVTLYRYDKQTWAAAGGQPQGFTHEYDMGWNLVGMPWLVSNYTTKQNMSHPSILYKLDKDAHYYHFESWADAVDHDNDDSTPTVLPALTTGDAFFTQLATLKDKVDIKFALPRKQDGNTAAPRATTIRLETGMHSDVVELRPDAHAQHVAYTIGADAAKLFSPDNDVTQFFALTHDGLPIAMSAAAPTATDITLGTRITDDADSCTISLPSTDAWHDYDVWLTDHIMQRVTNLKHNSYTFAPYPQTTTATTTANPQTTSIGRFTLRIGGAHPDIPGQQVQYIVTSHNGHITISGLADGDNIAIYTASGQLLRHDTAQSNVYTTYITPETVLIIRINNTSYKIKS